MALLHDEIRPGVMTPGHAPVMLREVVEMAYLWRVPHALDGAALHAAVGPLPVTPIDEALESALVDLGFGARTAMAR